MNLFFEKASEKIRKRLKGFFGVNHKNKPENNNQSINSLSENLQMKEAYRHSQNYSKLLDLYVKSTEQNINLRLKFKILFFISTIGSMFAIVIIFALAMFYAIHYFNSLKTISNIKLEMVLSILTIVIPAFSSFLVAFLKMPKIIAKYLFNIEEDRYMDSIIKNIQDYDREMFIATQQKIMDSLLKNKNKSIEEMDDDIEDLDNDVKADVSISEK